MKQLGVLVLLVVMVQKISAQSAETNLDQLEKSFLLAPSVYRNYESLQFLLTTQYEHLTREQRNRIRGLLDRSTFSRITTYPLQEEGTRIVVRGRVTDQNGKPIPSAKISFFQTDALGYYAPPDAKTKRMSESDARLYGTLRTNAQGEYELQAIRPANYPVKYEGRSIPQHIHFNLSANGFTELKLQVVFDDDPAMQDDHWRVWAKEQGFPIVKLAKVNGQNIGTCNVSLQRK